MASVNKVVLLGNLGKPPELKHTQNGTSFLRISLATSEHWTDQSGQRQEKTEWHRVVLWKKQADNVAKYCTKGSQIYIEGRLETRSWDDQSGEKRYQTEVVAEVVKFLGRGREESPPAEARSRGGKDLAISGDFGDGDLGDVPY